MGGRDAGQVDATIAGLTPPIWHSVVKLVCVMALFFFPYRGQLEAPFTPLSYSGLRESFHQLRPSIRRVVRRADIMMLIG